MLRAIQNFFRDKIDPGHRPVEDADRHRLQIATAALLIEMTRVDAESTEVERRTIVDSLQTKFALTAQETHDLLALAEAEASEAIDYYQFTSLIKSGFSSEQKERVVEYLWLVSMSDGEVDKHEEYLVRKVAALIGVPHETFIATKARAREATSG